jgi:2'-5' RNA ligase
MRSFVAIVLPPHIKKGIETLEQKLKAYPFNIRWVNPRNVHLTLKFIGDIQTHQVADVAKAMALTATGFSPVDLCMQGLGVFPGIRNPRVFWTGLGGQTDLLGQLQGTLDQALAEAGFALEKRPFKGHLTLGRFKGRALATDVAQAIQIEGRFEAIGFSAIEMALFKSDLHPKGAKYTLIQQYRIGETLS